MFRFLEHYNKVNELLEKRKILEYLIDTFCETGHFDENIPTYLTQLKSTSFETLFEQYKTAIINALAEIDKQYKQNNEIYSLSEEQYSLLSHMATKTIFLSEDIPKLIMGYEKQTGLCEKKDQIRIEKVRKNIDDSYSVTYTLFGHDVKFDAKYFVLRDIDETSKNAETNYLNKLKNLRPVQLVMLLSLENYFKSMPMNYTLIWNIWRNCLIMTSLICKT